VTYKHRAGWFADPGDKDDDGYDERYPWRPYLQISAGCVPLRLWFASKEDCEQFIRDEVLGKGLLPDLG
jgi:hypothetical protein